MTRSPIELSWTANNISLLHFAKSESPNLFAQTCCISGMREHFSPQSILQSQYLVQGEQGLGRAVLFSSGCHHTQSTVSLLGERSCFTKLGLLKRRRWVSKLVILNANLPLPGHLVSILGTVRLRTACQPALRRNRADQAASISPRSTSGQLFGPSAKRNISLLGFGRSKHVTHTKMYFHWTWVQSLSTLVEPMWLWLMGEQN